MVEQPYGNHSGPAKPERDFSNESNQSDAPPRGFTSGLKIGTAIVGTAAILGSLVLSMEGGKEPLEGKDSDDETNLTTRKVGDNLTLSDLDYPQMSELNLSEPQQFSGQASIAQDKRSGEDSREQRVEKAAAGQDDPRKGSTDDRAVVQDPVGPESALRNDDSGLGRPETLSSDSENPDVPINRSARAPHPGNERELVRSTMNDFRTLRKSYQRSKQAVPAEVSRSLAEIFNSGHPEINDLYAQFHARSEALANLRSIANSGKGPGRIVAREELKEILDTALDALSEDERRAFSIWSSAMSFNRTDLQIFSLLARDLESSAISEKEWDQIASQILKLALREPKTEDLSFADAKNPQWIKDMRDICAEVAAARKDPEVAPEVIAKLQDIYWSDSIYDDEAPTPISGARVALESLRRLSTARDKDVRGIAAPVLRSLLERSLPITIEEFDSRVRRELWTNSASQFTRGNAEVLSHMGEALEKLVQPDSKLEVPLYERELIEASTAQVLWKRPGHGQVDCDSAEPDWLDSVLSRTRQLEADLQAGGDSTARALYTLIELYRSDDTLDDGPLPARSYAYYGLKRLTHKRSPLREDPDNWKRLKDAYGEILGTPLHQVRTDEIIRNYSLVRRGDFFDQTDTVALDALRESAQDGLELIDEVAANPSAYDFPLSEMRVGELVNKWAVNMLKKIEGTRPPEAIEQSESP